jgi:hypothetical protein
MSLPDTSVLFRPGLKERAPHGENSFERRRFQSDVNVFEKEDLCLTDRNSESGGKK